MIRPVRYRDLAAIGAIRRVSQSNDFEWWPNLALRAWPSTAGTFFAGVLPARSMHTYVLEEGGQIFGFIQARPRSSSPDKWDVIRMVATVDRPADVWLRLLEYVCVAGGNHGARKFFANIAEDADELDIFRQIGFYRFTSEQSLSLNLDGGGSAPAMPPWLRPAQSRDAFAILQLYSATAPRNVQQAEGLTARDWAPPSGRMSGWLHRVNLAQESPQSSWSFVAEEDGKVYAWVRLRWRDARCHLSFLIHPEKRGQFVELRDFIIGTARANQPCMLRVQVREYQQEMLPLFEEVGFRLEGRYLLLAKHIVVQVMERRLAPVLTRA